MMRKAVVLHNFLVQLFSNK